MCIRDRSTISKVDKEFIDYFKNKNRCLDDTNPQKYFLLSLLPEVNELNESQFRVFKRTALALLDEKTMFIPEIIFRLPLVLYIPVTSRYCRGSIVFV